MSRHLHIVCLDAPSPADYGGAIDMYYKIAALAQSGYKIILHYFDYRKGRSAAGLEPYCIEINSYTRKTGLAGCAPLLPYIVSSRINKQLLRRLQMDAYPVLLEGLHCYGIASKLAPGRRVALRMHNDEAAYYKGLAKAEKNLIKKSYYTVESLLLHQYQKRISKAVPLACISLADVHSLTKKYGADNLHYIPGFSPWQAVSSKEGLGSYCLYHGNMQVAENENAAIWLIDQVFSEMKTALIIAGKNISLRLQNTAHGHPHIKLINNPTNAELDALIEAAQLHVLPSLNGTGLKLKLLHALLRGRHVLTNNAGAAGTDYAAALHTADTPEQFRKKVDELMIQPFTKADAQKKAALLATYDNEANAVKLSALL